MPCYIIAGYSNHERTLFNETVHGNFVAIINEEKSFNSDDWTCTHHVMIPKIFLHLFSKLSLKNSKKDEELNIKYLSYLTNSGKHTDLNEPPALQVDISTLSKPVKKILYKYDCDVTPMCENQFKYFKEIEFFDRLWGMEQIESPSVVTPKADPSPAVSPWLDEPGCSTPKRTPVATVSNHMENLTPSLCLALLEKKEVNNTRESAGVFGPYITLKLRLSFVDFCFYLLCIII